LPKSGFLLKERHDFGEGKFSGKKFMGQRLILLRLRLEVRRCSTADKDDKRRVSLFSLRQKISISWTA
jgi:hypothetical protein